MNTQEHKTHKGWTLERSVLSIIVVLQLIIIGWLYQLHRERQEAQPQQQRSRHVVPVQSSMPASRLLQQQHNRMQARMNRMMNQAFGAFDNAIDFDKGWDRLSATPTMDMRNRPDSYEIIFSHPGLTAENIQVQLKKQLLTVTTTRNQDQAGARNYNRFESKILLPGPVDASKPMKTDFTNGILRLTIAKQFEQE
jgi:HSP20 family molecular chaperone IbpA